MKPKRQRPYCAHRTEVQQFRSRMQFKVKHVHSKVLGSIPHCRKQKIIKQKSKIPSLGMVEHICNPKYSKVCQEDYKFETSLDNLAGLSQNTKD